MSEKMIEIKGQKVSESTIVEALKRHCSFQENYQFQTGDVAKNEWGEWRVVIKTDIGLIIGCDKFGNWQGADQKDFESVGYQKITTLSELIECWEKHNG